MTDTAMPELKKLKVEYHTGSDTHYVVAWFVGSDPDTDIPDLSIRVEKAGAYLGDAGAREAVARYVATKLTGLFPAAQAQAVIA